MTGAGIFIRLIAFGLALLSLEGGDLPAEAGTRKAAREINQEVARSSPPSVRPDGKLVLIKLRTGLHPSHTRIVLELSGPAEWSVQKAADGSLLILVPKATLDEGIREVTSPRGLLRGVHPKRLPGGLEVRIVTAPPLPEYRTLTLENPDRLVVDCPRDRDGTSSGVAPPSTTCAESSAVATNSSPRNHSTPTAGCEPAAESSAATGTSSGGG